jgi:ParB-like chromosome segregation protein Spo0J
MIAKIEIHPAANLFPMMAEDQFQLLKADIQEHGQREDAVVWKGLLIDGRNRVRACRELGLEPEVAELPDEDDPVAYVISHNLHRRHLSTNQRACVAAKLATLKHGGDRQSEEFKGSIDLSCQDDAATLLNVSVPALKRAKHVIENASSAVIDAVESDEIKASLAYKFIGLCDGKRDQAKIVKEGVKAVRAYVKEKAPPKAKKKKATEPLIETNAEYTTEALVENAEAIKGLKAARNPVVVISKVLFDMDPEQVTSILLHCETLLERRS